MIDRLAALLEARLAVPTERTKRFLEPLANLLATLAFVLVMSFIVAFDAFVDVGDIASLQVGDIPQQNIIAPEDVTYTSEILTQQAREEARNNVQPVYDPPDPNVARQQIQLAQQILDYIENVRRDPFGTVTQKIGDLNAITALEQDERINELILQMDDEAWGEIESEILNVLPRVMRESIRPDQLSNFRAQLPTQVSVRFGPQQSDVIVAILEDLLRPNTFENAQETAEQRDEAATNVQAVQRSFRRGEIVINEGVPIDALSYEALQALGLLRVDELRTQDALRAFLASILVTVTIGLYLARFAPHLLSGDDHMLTLSAAIFVVALFAIRLLGLGNNIYVFPVAAIGLIYVAIAGQHIALIGSLGLALLVGLMNNNSLEFATLVASSSIIGILVLRRAERLNMFFVAGFVVGLVNALIVGIFALATPANAPDNEMVTTLALTVASGFLLVPATAIAGMYVLTQAFNLPTALKLLELSQPNKPLLQRLLREAPGTYQHSLQVGNLAEQAAEAIGADANLTHVAALYHDIGKMQEPLYFTENQAAHIGNPHDGLDDPYRSAGIIIRHVTAGGDLAREYRLPHRLRDFIWEHHGTTQVYIFYKQALDQASAEDSVDISEFTYPGPKPRSRETAILMLADSCEAAVRSVQPDSKQAISELVANIIEGKRKQGQLDQSGLTLTDLQKIQDRFVDILQGMFHPRINYQEATASKREAKSAAPATPSEVKTPIATQEVQAAKTDKTDQDAAPPPETHDSTAPVITRPANADTSDPTEEDVEEPLPEVPRLPRSEERRNPNGKKTTSEHEPVPDPEKRPDDDDDAL